MLNNRFKTTCKPNIEQLQNKMKIEMQSLTIKVMHINMQTVCYLREDG